MEGGVLCVLFFLGGCNILALGYYIGSIDGGALWMEAVSRSKVGIFALYIFCLLIEGM